MAHLKNFKNKAQEEAEEPAGISILWLQQDYRKQSSKVFRSQEAAVKVYEAMAEIFHIYYLDNELGTQSIDNDKPPHQQEKRT